MGNFPPLINKLSFLEPLQVHSKISRNTEISLISPIPTQAQAPPLARSHTTQVHGYIAEATLTHSYHLSPQGTLGLSLGVVQALSFDKHDGVYRSLEHETDWQIAYKLSWQTTAVAVRSHKTGSMTRSCHIILPTKLQYVHHPVGTLTFRQKQDNISENVLTGPGSGAVTF